MKYRIVNRRRFITFLVIAILLAYFLVVGLLNYVFAASGDRELVYVTIASGDTLWDIAKDYSPDKKDVRRTVYEICRINDISAGEIYPGQVISVPLE